MAESLRGGEKAISSTAGGSGGAGHELRFDDSRGAGFDAPQRLPAENPFPAGRALVEFEVGNRVSFPLEFAGPIPADLLDLIASASRAKCDVLHISFGRGATGRRYVQFYRGGRVWKRPAARSKTHDPHRPSWRRHSACRAATLGSAGELRSPKPAESRLRAKLPAPQARLGWFSSLFVGRRPILTGMDASASSPEFPVKPPASRRRGAGGGAGRRQLSLTAPSAIAAAGHAERFMRRDFAKAGETASIRRIASRSKTFSLQVGHS